MYKIKYVLNLLPSTLVFDEGEEDQESIMEIISTSEELEIFNTKCLQDLIEFQWNTYAKWIHYTGASVHMTYVFMFFMYVNQVYIERNESDVKDIYIFIMGGLLLYPMLYDML